MYRWPGRLGEGGGVRYRMRVIGGWIVDRVEGAVPGGNTVPL